MKIIVWLQSISEPHDARLTYADGTAGGTNLSLSNIGFDKIIAQLIWLINNVTTRLI